MTALGVSLEDQGECFTNMAITYCPRSLLYSSTSKSVSIEVLRDLDNLVNVA